MNQDKMIKYYNKEEIKKLLKANEKLIYIDTGNEEVVGRYIDLPDIILDINKKLGLTNLKIYDYQNVSLVPIVTTYGYYLDKCKSKVRTDIIERLTSLQLDEEEIKDYKLIDEEMLEDVKRELFEMER